MAKKTEPKLSIDTNYRATEKNQRFDMRCSKNFKVLVEILVDKLSEGQQYSWNRYTKSDVLTQALTELAIKKKVLTEEERRHI